MHSKPLMVDAASILESAVTISANYVDVAGIELQATHAWLRRLAPAVWASAIDAPGADQASHAAAIAALAAIIRDPRFTWLTALDQFGKSENKAVQYRQASAAGVPVPKWLITTDPNSVPSTGTWVVKPLGPGSFIDGTGLGRIVPTRLVDITDPNVIAAAPFIIQQLIPATIHARVVTVGDNVWSATLPAENLPLDWRLSSESHRAFTRVPTPDHVHDLAREAARSNGVGFTAQDWIRDTSGSWWFVDLNPAGQWLFLPPEVAEPVTAAIAAFLDNHR
ncbi:hypothetical protein SAMN04489812_5601 [Microlunatus soli]|uniref:ATP-grasp domain-containing protein n=2 Tax=Microlunatus soli TaxID=630515 RepID=A0A1H2A254_9ACTN|nr:hypothetical protein SAMN04489812_5601 [Microlunatus soli]